MAHVADPSLNHLPNRCQKTDPWLLRQRDPVGRAVFRSPPNRNLLLAYSLLCMPVPFNAFVCQTDNIPAMSVGVVVKKGASKKHETAAAMYAECVSVLLQQPA